MKIDTLDDLISTLLTIRSRYQNGAGKLRCEWDDGTTIIQNIHVLKNGNVVIDVNEYYREGIDYNDLEDIAETIECFEPSTDFNVTTFTLDVIEQPQNVLYLCPRMPINAYHARAIAINEPTPFEFNERFETKIKRDGYVYYYAIGPAELPDVPRDKRKSRMFGLHMISDVHHALPFCAGHGYGGHLNLQDCKI